MLLLWYPKILQDLTQTHTELRHNDPDTFQKWPTVKVCKSPQLRFADAKTVEHKQEGACGVGGDPYTSHQVKQSE